MDHLNNTEKEEMASLWAKEMAEKDQKHMEEVTFLKAELESSKAKIQVQ